jgi:predicted ATPase/DNA-binding SARP family transcriptional activator
MTRLALALLGPLRITLDGKPVSGFAYNKARALLAYLAVEADRGRHRDALVGLLWPDLPDTAARANLRVALANLREVIGDTSATPPFLLIARDTIQFNPASDYDLDVSTFTALLVACETHAHRHMERCRSCATRMQQALALYHGDFLAEFALGDSAPFEEWQLRQRERLHQRALDALARLADYHERRGDDEPARRYAQRQIELDPWREEAHRQLMRLLARGHQRSAALAQYETCRRTLARDLGVEPEAETTALYKGIRDGVSSELRVLGSELPAQGRETQNSKLRTQNVQNFPAQTSQLIGRESELAELGSLLENPAHRLITITGPGGIGKTRLALAAAAEQAEAFSHSAAFVPLAGLSSAAFLAPAILSALDVALQGQRDPRDQLFEYLRGKELLLVLDNVEQLLVVDQSENDGIAGLLSAILERASGATLLVTSRERLALAGEWLFDLSGLSYPLGELGDSLEGYSAVQLFMQRAGQVRRQFALAEGEARAVARICRLVEGLPLAIEQAAAALRTRSCIAVADALESSMMGLASGLRAIPERHRSMWATFEHTWRLLSDQERQVFPRLSVFRGGFQEDAAAEVAQASPQLLAALLDKSLLRWDGTMRYDMHALVRQYAGEKLEQAEAAEETRRQHATYFLALAEAAELELNGADPGILLERLEVEHDNFRAALTWAVAGGSAEVAARLAAALGWFWDTRGYLSEGRRWLEAALERNSALPASARAKALAMAGRLARSQGDHVRATALYEVSLRLWWELGRQERIAETLLDLGSVAVFQGDDAQATARLTGSLGMFRAQDDQQGIAWALKELGALANAQGTIRAPKRCWRRAWPASSNWTTRLASPTPCISWAEMRGYRATTRGRWRWNRRAWRSAEN